MNRQRRAADGCVERREYALLNELAQLSRVISEPRQRVGVPDARTRAFVLVVCVCARARARVCLPA